jgi:hypothetical protein
MIQASKSMIPSGEPKPDPIRVKMVFRSNGDSAAVESEMTKRFPGAVPVWGACRFLFSTDERDYDWLVVYDDLPPRAKERFSLAEEILACPRAHTLVITTEPSSIKTYGNGYLQQFGYVLTSQEPEVIRHPHAIFSQAALIWFYGRRSDHGSLDRMVGFPPIDKTELISTVCSSKQQKHTLHRARYQFTQELKLLIPELKVFGHGVQPIKDKAEALDAFRYHIAIENHVCLHHWTEKLSDSFLGHCLPFYYGCPNAAEYFPEDSFIPIDITDAPRAAALIREAIAANEYERRLPAIQKARNLVLEQYGLFATVSRIIEERHDSAMDLKPSTSGEVILSRRAWRKGSLRNAVSYLIERGRSVVRTRMP